MKPEKAIKSLRWKVYKGGIVALRMAAITSKTTHCVIKGLQGSGIAGLQIAGHAICSPLAWGFAGCVLISESVINYKLMKKGKIDKGEFKKRFRSNTIGSVGGIACSSAFASVGFLVGSAVCPGIGSGVGVFFGAVIGGMVGKGLSVMTLNKIEKRLEKYKTERRSTI